MKHRLAFLTAILAFLALLLPKVAHAAPGQEEKLPAPPPPLANVPNFGTTVRPDGTPIAVVVPSGIGGVVNIVDLNTGASSSLPLSDKPIDVQAWGFATLPDKSVLIGSAHHLFRYDPAKDEKNQIEQLSDAGIPGWEQVNTTFENIWDIAVDEAGNAYLTTNAKRGGAHVLTWSRAKGWGLLPGGAPVSEAQYAQAIDYADGHVYVGTGNSEVLRINVSTGARSEVSVTDPQGWKGILGLEVHGDWLYTNKSNAYGVVAVNLRTGDKRDLKGYSETVVTRPGDPTKVYFAHNSESSGYWLFSYDPTTDTREVVLHDQSLRSRMSPLSWASQDIFVSNEMTTGELSVAHIPSGKVTVRNDQVTSGPRAIQSMTAAPNGKLYGSWYMTAQELLEVTPGATAEATSSRLMSLVGKEDVGQAESITADGDWLAAGMYPGGRVRIQSLSDPKEVTIKEIGAGQDRPYAAIPLGEGDFAFGSVPGYGQLGGALSIYDGAAKSLDTYAFDKSTTYAPGVNGSLLRDLAPISLAQHGGKIYMGTTNRGGHQMFAKTREAYVVEFDIAKRQVTAITQVFDQQVAVTGLTVGADGVLYGITGQHVFKLVDGKVVGQQLTKAAGEYNRSWLLERGGTLYAVVGGQLWSIPTGGFAAAQVIANSGEGNAWITGLSLATDGYLYYAKGGELFRHSAPRS